MDITKITQTRINETTRQNTVKTATNTPKNGADFTEIIKQRLNNSAKINDILNVKVAAQPQEVTTLTFSKHAKERLENRNIEMSDEFISEIQSALERASAKGIKNALMLSNDSAFIVNIASKTVITAMNMDEMRNNIITNIDGTVII